MKSFYIAIALMITSSCGIFAQKNTRPDYKLFWKISGNGLARPSYLFGTMHVQDNRAFDFSDSVLFKISECEAFAMEVHPDSVTRYVFKMLFGNDQDETDRFRELLNEKQYRRLDSLMKKRTGYALNKFKTPLRAKLFLQNHHKKKDKDTFVDAWLYNIAHQQQKVILGLEDTQKHLNALRTDAAKELREIDQYLNQDRDAADEDFRSMLELYHTGDINRIRDAARAGFDQLQYDELITNRNLDIVAEIKKAIHRQSTFIAVGAAHLAGDEGIIRLLQASGYEVTAMEPLFTGLAAKFKYTAKELEWTSYTSAEGAYEIEMPQQPFPLNHPGLPFTFQAYIDIGGPYFYMTTHFPVTGTVNGRSSGEFLDAFVKNLNSKRGIESVRKFTIQGMEGREVDFMQDGQYFKVQLIHRGNMMYMLMAGPTAEFTRSPEARRFFNSFKTVMAVDQDAKEFSHKAGAFSVHVPAKISEHLITPKDANGQQFTLHVFQSVKPMTGETFLLRYNDFPEGYISTDDSIYYAGIIEQVLLSAKGNNLSVRDVAVSGFKGVGFSFDVNDVVLEGITVLRGNRNYLGLTSREKTQPAEAAHAFLGSLQFMPYPSTPVKKFKTPEGLSIYVPEDFDSSPSPESGNQTQYYILDTASGIVYLVTVEKFSRYAEAGTADEYLHMLSALEASEGDSIVTEDRLTDKSYIGTDIGVKSARTNYIKRVRKIIAGEHLFQLQAFLPADYALSDLPRKFFEEFSIENTTSSWSLFQDKTAMLISDLASEDTLVREEAKEALWDHEFQPADLPMLYRAIKKSYADDNEFFGSTRSRLLGILADVHDDSTILFITDFYNSLPDSSGLKDHALGVLTSMRKQESIDELFGLIQRDTARELNVFVALSGLSDSIELVLERLPDLLTLQERSNYPSTVFNIVADAIAKDLVPDNMRKDILEQVLAMARNFRDNHPSLIEEDPHYYTLSSRMAGLTDLMVSLPFSPEIKELLTVFQKYNAPEAVMTITLHLIKNRAPVDQDALNRIAADPLFRFSLYEQLHAMGMDKYMNARYRTLRMMAESDFIAYMEADEGQPAEVQILKARKVIYRGATQVIFPMKYRYGEGDTWYIGFAGPYAPRANEFTRGQLTGANYGEYENDKQVDRLINDLIAAEHGTRETE